MAWNYFYKDRSGAQNGPVSLEELAALVKAGRIAPDCLVWSEGFEPAPASSYEALAEAFRNRFASGAAAGGGPLQPAFPVWGLFWRGVVFVLGFILVIPAPWVGIWYYNWFASRIALPNGRRLLLETSIGESWYIFVGLILAELIPLFFGKSPIEIGLSYLLAIASVYMGYLLTRWFSRSLRSEDGALKVAFEGGFPAYLGWTLLMVVSSMTIVGWAWVLKYQMRWICRWTRGSHAFAFVASGWSILWRALAVFFGSMFVVTIPWLMRWFYNWYVSQIVVMPSAASLAKAERMAA